MAKRGRKIPEGEEREARDVQVSIYVTEREREILERAADNMGFRSKSALIAYVLEPLIENGFSGVTFMKMGGVFASLISKNPKNKVDTKQFNVFKKLKVPDLEDVNREQK